MSEDRPSHYPRRCKECPNWLDMRALDLKSDVCTRCEMLARAPPLPAGKRDGATKEEESTRQTQQRPEGMTIKQWHAEKAERLNSELRRIAAVVVPYDATSPAVTKRIMEQLMEILSDRQSKVLQYVEERYDSATRRTVERMLSEFTTGMTSGQSIADRMKNYETIFSTLQAAGVTNSLDRMHVMALMATIAHGGRMDFRLTQGHKGDYAVRVRPRKEENG